MGCKILLGAKRFSYSEMEILTEMGKLGYSKLVDDSRRMMDVIILTVIRGSTFYRTRFEGILVKFTTDSVAEYCYSLRWMNVSSQ